VSATYRIRDAFDFDIDALVAFTLREAQESEGLALDEAAVRRGVSRAFEPHPPARYWMAEHADERVGSIAVLREWSNFHGGNYWWIQSLFILPEHRGTGLVELLIEHVARVAQAAGALDVRLYAHASNARAVHAYERSGFTTAPYVMMRRHLDATSGPAST
jgi:ribosomal protein S18 acetylase RimI-like enzyme